jgi:hypothetical protein
MIFVYGLIVDYFCLTDGIATFSLLLLVLFRFLILKIIYNKDESEAPVLNREIQGYAFIFRYVFIGVFFYHLTFFLVESFKFYDILYNLMRTILTTVFVVLFYSLINFIYLSKQKK